jgi:hypothetical protein
MTMNDATEAAYKHGYEDGYIAAVKQMILAEILTENDEEKENEQDT